MSPRLPRFMCCIEHQGKDFRAFFGTRICRKREVSHSDSIDNELLHRSADRWRSLFQGLNCLILDLHFSIRILTTINAKLKFASHYEKLNQIPTSTKNEFNSMGFSSRQYLLRTISVGVPCLLVTDFLFNDLQIRSNCDERARRLFEKNKGKYMKLNCAQRADRVGYVFMPDQILWISCFNVSNH